jgi:SAM-dependent methyltransferase
MITARNSVDALMRLSGAHCVSRALHVIADLGIADALGETPERSDALAAAAGVHADALDRALRLLSEYGVFAVQDGAFKHTPASRLLRNDHPGSLRSFVRMMGFPIYWRMWEAFGMTVRTGVAAAAEVMPEGGWKYLAEHPEEGRIFDDAMAAKSQAQIPAVLASYDFSKHPTIADIGGGTGHLLRAVLAATPNATGVLFDLPGVVATAAKSPMPGLSFAHGDFFTDALPSCDCYLVMHVLHDWADADALRILEAVRHAAPEGAALLVLESIISDEPNPTWERILDLHMLAIHAGRERSVEQFRDLFAGAGFRLVRSIDTQAGVRILEARKTG